MKTIIRIVFFLMIFLNFLFSQLAKDDVKRIVLNEILKDDVGKVDIYQLSKQVVSGIKVKVAYNEAINAPFDESYVFFVDDQIYANWGHPCRYIFVSTETGESKIFKRNFFPSDFSSYEIISKADRPVIKAREIVQSKQRSPAAPDYEWYAVLISGGWNSAYNYERYWRDISAFFCTLREVYGITKNQIYVHMDDGTGEGCPYADHDDLDGPDPQSDDIDYDATFSTIENTFKALGGTVTDPNIPELDQNDKLIVFVTDHGSGGNNFGDMNSSICLWNEELLHDDQLAGWLDDINAKEITIVMEQCHSGGFIDDCSAPNRKIYTACAGWEGSYAEKYETGWDYDEFSYFYTAALRGYFPGDYPWEIDANRPAGNGITYPGHDEINPDLNENGSNSFEECNIYANYQDTWSEFGVFDPYFTEADEWPMQYIEPLSLNTFMTWSKYQVINHDISITGNLSIEPGTKIYFYPDIDLLNEGNFANRSEIIFKGNNQISGTDDKKIEFISLSDTPGADDWGGIRCTDNSSVSISHSIIKDAVNGIWFEDAANVLLENIAISNTDEIALYFKNTQGYIKNSSILNNYGSLYQDGMYIDNSNMEIAYNFIGGNQRYGIQSIPGKSLNIHHNVIYENGYGGLHIWSTNYYSTIISNNTIVENFDTGLWVYPPSVSSDVAVENNIVAYNQGKGIYNGSAYYTLPIDYNNVYSNSGGNYYNCNPGSNDISQDPSFVNQSNDDYHLNSNSPCIDKGDASTIDDDGTIADMGALYHPHGIINYPTTWNRNLDLQLDVTVSNGASLTIMPDNVIKFAAGKKLHVYGNLSANGSANNIIFTSLNTNPSNGDWYGIRIDGSNASASIDNCTIKYGDRGIRFYNSASGTVSNSEINNNNYGVYLYKSKPTIQDCEINDCTTAGIYLSDNNYISGDADIINNSIHDHDMYGIFCYKSSPEIRENTIETNYKGVYCTNSSSPLFGAPYVRGNNIISGCYIGLSANYDSDPLLYLSYPRLGGWNQFINASSFIRAYSYSNVYAENNWWGSSPPDHNKFSAYYNSSIDYTPWLTSDPSAPPPPESPPSNSALSSSGYDENWSLKRKIDYGKSLIYLDNPAESKKICADIIDLYPDSSLSFLALNVYWAADRYQSEKEKTGQKDFQDLLINMSAKKYKCELHGYSELLLAGFEADKGLSRIDKVYNEYKDSFLPEAALYQKFLYYLNAKEDLSSALAVNDQLNKEYPESSFTEWSNEHLSSESSFNKKQSLSDNDSKENQIPFEYNLSSNYPNPFNPTTRIKLDLPEGVDVKLEVFNIRGQKVATLVDGYREAGSYEVFFDGRRLASGVYFYRVSTPKFTAIKRMLLVK